LFSLLREPPERGSLQESVLMAFVLKKEQVEHSRLRALAQLLISKEKGKEVFDDYMKVAFPWLETAKTKEHADHVRILKEEVKKGLVIRPLQESRVKSRFKTRVVEREAPTRSVEEQNALYKKLGKVIPT
jgi:hypothetical protein